MFRALGSRNYRLFFTGQLISLVGIWLANLAMAWLVYRLTGSALLLGTVAFCAQVPAFLVGPFAGVMLDRWDLRRVLLITQALMMAITFTLAVITLTGVVQVHHLMLLAVAQGLVNGFDLPARQSFVVQLVEKREDLGNAIALNSSMFNSARLLGPSIGGILIAWLGEGACFLINGCTYTAVITGFLLIRVPTGERPGQARRVLAELREGVAYAWGFKPIRATLMLLALTSLLGAPYTVLLPVFANDILAGGAATFGVLSAATGVGALIGAFMLAARKTVVGIGSWIVGGAVLFGLALVAFSQSRVLWLSVPLLVLSGMGMILSVASSNTILQTIVEDEKRGRVMSLFTMSFMGMMPLGSLIAGTLASPARLGAPATLAVGGALVALSGAYFATQLPRLRLLVRPIYLERGLIPEVTTGVQAATALRMPPRG